MYTTNIPPANPYQLSLFSNQPGPQLLKVNGIESAKVYPTQPNSMIALFDANEDVMYIKTTDTNNFSTIKRYVFIEEPEPAHHEVQKYVTIEEFTRFKEELLNGKQPVRSESN